MKKFLFVGGPEDGNWHEIPEKEIGKERTFPMPLKENLTKVRYVPMTVRCGPEHLRVYALAGMTSGAILAKVLRSYGRCP